MIIGLCPDEGSSIGERRARSDLRIGSGVGGPACKASTSISMATNYLGFVQSSTKALRWPSCMVHALYSDPDHVCSCANSLFRRKAMAHLRRESGGPRGRQPRIYLFVAWKLRDAEPVVRIPTSSFIGSNDSFVSPLTAWKGSPRHIGYVIIGEIPR